MIPPIYHSLRRECIKNAAHSHPYGVRSVRPTWFEDWKIPFQSDLGDPSSFQPMHGLKLVIKEDVMPQEQMLFFPSCASVVLARSSYIVVLMNELTRCKFYVPPWEVESGVRTITQSKVLSGPKKKKHKNKAKQQKQNPQKPAKEALTKTAPIGLAANVPMNYEILHRNKRTTPDHIARSCKGVQQNNPLSSAETQNPLCQHPGDRAEKSSGHETSSQ